MKKVFAYIRHYFLHANMQVHLVCACVLAVLVFINYVFGLNRWLYTLPKPLPFVGWYLLLFAALLFPYTLYHFSGKATLVWNKHFWTLLLLAPFVFTWKMTAPLRIFPPDADFIFWNGLLYFVLKALAVTCMLLMLRQLCGEDSAVMGLRSPLGKMRPYLVMLLVMVPLIAAAATQKDFLVVYPKVGHMLPRHDLQNPLKILLFEAAYGIDFFTIELFFRGFLVIYLSRWAGTNSILPMACIYCVIHFGKPLGECISSFFGGLLLGIVSYNTRSIWGGLAVHLGIAWLMELAGWYALPNPLSP